MKKTMSGAVGALLLATASAFGADIPRGGGTAWEPGPGYSWSGPYLGLNLAYQWASVSRLPNNPSGFAGGGQAGYNFQRGPWVFGVETDLQGSGASDTFAPYKFSNPWFGTLRGRGGYAMNNILLYATAGFAYGGGRVDFAGLNESQTHWGWTAGGGIEIGFTPHWSAKAEYLYVNLNDKVYVLTGASNGVQSSLLRFGVNYRF